MKAKESYTLTSIVLLIIGCIDLLRGFLHTFQVNWASSTFAHLDLTVARSDQLWLLGTFGISNILTGLLYILISRKAKELSPYVLLIIPIAYLLGIIGLRSSGIVPDADFLGKYLLVFYLGACVATSAIFFGRKYFRGK
jgi:hypothetical protein